MFWRVRFLHSVWLFNSYNACVCVRAHVCTLVRMFVIVHMFVSLEQMCRCVQCRANRLFGGSIRKCASTGVHVCRESDQSVGVIVQCVCDCVCVCACRGVWNMRLCHLALCRTPMAHTIPPVAPYSGSLPVGTMQPVVEEGKWTEELGSSCQFLFFFWRRVYLLSEKSINKIFKDKKEEKKCSRGPTTAALSTLSCLCYYLTITNNDYYDYYCYYS